MFHPNPQMYRDEIIHPYDLSAYISRDKVYSAISPHSTEVELDLEDTLLVVRLAAEFEHRANDPAALAELHERMSRLFDYLYSMRYHRYHLLVDRVWFDAYDSEVRWQVSCFEAVHEPMDCFDHIYGGLNDADRLASLVMHRDPPSKRSTHLYEGPGQKTVLDVFKSLEKAHLRGNVWPSRSYRIPDQPHACNVRGRVVSAILFDGLVWGKLLSFAPEYRRLLNPRSGLGFVYGIPMFRISPGSGFLPAGSIVLLVTDELQTLRGSPLTLQHNLVVHDVGIVHYYDYYRARYAGYSTSRVVV